MTMKRIVLSTIALGIGVVALGWLLYPVLVALVVMGKASGVVAASSDSALTHRLLSVAPMFSIGVAAGASSAFIGGARRSAINYWRAALGFLAIGVVAWLIGAMFLAPSSMAVSSVDGLPQAIQLPLEALPLWKAGVGGLVAVIVSGVIAVMRSRSAHN